MNFNFLSLFMLTCQDLEAGGLAATLQEACNIIMIVVPVLVLILVVVDFVKAVVAGKEDDMKAAQTRAIKRIVIGLLIFFIPLLVNVFLRLIGFSNGTCGIG